jgi:hypothetical protein
MSSRGSSPQSWGTRALGDLGQHLGPRVEVLVDPVPEAHESHLAVLVLGELHVVLRGQVALVDLLQHGQHLHVGPAVQGPPQGADAGGAGGEQVGPAGADHAHRGGGAVLLVVGVQDQDQVQCLPHHIGADVLLVGLGEHHVQEVRHIAQRRVRVDVRQAPGVAEGVGGDGADLADEPRRRMAKLGRVLQLVELRVEAGEGVDHGREDGHGGRRAGEALELVLHPLVEVGVRVRSAGEGVVFRLGRQGAADQQPGDLDEGGAVGELLDGDAAVAQDALLPVDVGDGALAAPGVAVARVQGDVAGALPQGADVDGPLALAALDDGELVALPVQGQGGRGAGSSR